MVHVLLNEQRAGWRRQVFISGASRRRLPAAKPPVMAAFHFVSEWNLSSRVGYVICGLLSYFSCENVCLSCTDCRKMKSETKETHSQITAVLDILFFTHFVSSCFLYIFHVFVIKQQLPSHQAGNWPFTEFLYNSHYHWISDALVWLS